MGAEQSIDDYACCQRRQPNKNLVNANAAYDHIQMFRLCECGQHAMLEDFLKRKAGSVDVNAIDSDGNSPLHVAADCGHLGVCKTLVMRGADVRKRDYAGMTPLDVARERKHQVVEEFLQGRLNMHPGMHFPALRPEEGERQGISKDYDPRVRKELFNSKVVSTREISEEEEFARQLFPPVNSNEKLVPVTVKQLFTLPKAMYNQAPSGPPLSPMSVETVFTPPGSTHARFRPEAQSKEEHHRISIV